MNDTPKQKQRRTGSPLAKATITAAAYRKTGLVGNRGGQYDYSGYYEREAVKLSSAVDHPLIKGEVGGVGGGGELKLNMPVTPGDIKSLELRNTVDDPTLLTASAQLDRLRLAEEAGVLDLALDAADTIQPKNSLEKMKSHQMAAAHTLAMRMAGAAGVWLDRATPDDWHDGASRQLASIEAARLATASAKLMQVFQGAYLNLHRVRTGGQQKVTVVHQHVQIAGGQVAVAGAIDNGGGGEDEGG